MRTRYSLFGFLGIIFGLFLVIISLTSAAADNFDQLRKDAANIKTIKARFVQKKSMKILSKPLISQGLFYYVAPDSFRWEYLKPLRSVVITYKGDTKRYIASGGKMIEDKTGGVQAMKIVLNEIAGWMSGKFDQNPSFAATLKEGAYTEITLTPVGKSMAGMIEKIKITLSKKDIAVKSVKIIESANAFTQIDFSDVQINKVISNKTFQDVE
ncbi:MAG: outer membrane lipoprotein carrier protein LolA [Smithellaceae bacterium]